MGLERNPRAWVEAIKSPAMRDSTSYAAAMAVMSWAPVAPPNCAEANAAGMTHGPGWVSIR